MEENYKNEKMFFFSGLDFKDHVDVFSGNDEDPGRRAMAMRKFIRKYQDSFTSIEKVSK